MHILRSERYLNFLRVFIFILGLVINSTWVLAQEVEKEVGIETELDKILEEIKELEKTDRALAEEVKKDFSEAVRNGDIDVKVLGDAPTADELELETSQDGDSNPRPVFGQGIETKGQESSLQIPVTDTAHPELGGIDEDTEETYEEHFLEVMKEFEKIGVDMSLDREHYRDHPPREIEFKDGVDDGRGHWRDYEGRILEKPTEHSHREDSVREVEYPGGRDDGIGHERDYEGRIIEGKETVTDDREEREVEYPGGVDDGRGYQRDYEGKIIGQ